MASRSFHLRNESTGEVHALSGDRISIGSAAGNTIILKGKGVPPTQCFLVEGDQGHTLMNFFPQNPVLVNDSEMDEAGLQPGDRIRFLGHSFTYLEAGKAAPAGDPAKEKVGRPMMGLPQKKTPAPAAGPELDSAPTLDEAGTEPRTAPAATPAMDDDSDDLDDIDDILEKIEDEEAVEKAATPGGAPVCPDPAPARPEPPAPPPKATPQAAAPKPRRESPPPTTPEQPRPKPAAPPSARPPAPPPEKKFPVAAAAGVAGLALIVVVLLAVFGVFGGKGPKPDDGGKTVPNPEAAARAAKEQAFAAALDAARAARDAAREGDRAEDWDRVLEETGKAAGIRSTPELDDLAAQGRAGRDLALARAAEQAGNLDEALVLATRAGTHGADADRVQERLSALQAKKAEREKAKQRKARLEQVRRKALDEEGRGTEADLETLLALWKEALTLADDAAERGSIETRVADATLRIAFARAMAEARAAESEGDFDAAATAAGKALALRADDPAAAGLLERAKTKGSGAPALVLVVIGEGVTDASVAPGDPDGGPAPRIWNDIRPRGAWLPVLKTMWVGKPASWFGECLTGIAFGGIGRDGDLFRFKAQALPELFAATAGFPAREGWLFLRPVEGPVAFPAQAAARLTVVAGPALADPARGGRDFALLAGELEGGPSDSDAFLGELGVRLLGAPEWSPRLALFLLGGPPADAGKSPDAMTAKLRADDALCGRLWDAFQSNPYYRASGIFAVVSRSGFAVLAGRGIPEGAVAPASYLNQIPATLAKALGYDPQAFLAPSAGRAKAAPVEGLFAE